MVGGRQTFIARQEAHTGFWNMSGLLVSCFEAFLGIRRDAARATIDSPRATFASASLTRSWQKTFDACSAEEALESYQVTTELLEIEIDRVKVAGWPSSTKLNIISFLRKQQIECAHNVSRLRQVISRDEKIVWPVSD